jgi:hypothetical protein
MRRTFARTWTYRGCVRDRDPDTPFDSLEFGRANMGVPPILRRCRRPDTVHCHGFS